MPSKSTSSRKVIDNALNISEAILTTLKEVSNVTPVPFLQQAAGSALIILGAVKKARNNKAAFEKLAAETCELVYKVIEIWPKEGATPQKLQADLKALIDTLLDIERYTTKQAKKRTIARFASCLLTSNSDADKIADYTKAVQKAFELFGFQSGVAVREDTAVIKAETHEILQEIKQQGDARTPPALPPPAYNIVTNTNSGNTTTTTIDNSNNEFSVSAYGAPENRRKPVTETQPPLFPPVYVAPIVIDPFGGTFTGNGGRMGCFGANITTNTNSGNTTTTTTTNSGNDYSFQKYGGHPSFYGPPPSPRGPNFHRGTVAFR